MYIHMHVLYTIHNTHDTIYTHADTACRTNQNEPIYGSFYSLHYPMVLSSRCLSLSLWIKTGAQSNTPTGENDV